MPRPRLRAITLDEVKITRDGDYAVFRYLDPDIRRPGAMLLGRPEAAQVPKGAARLSETSSWGNVSPLREEGSGLK